MLQAFPDPKIILVAIAYAIGAHGIMTLNDFKALKGDKALGINSLPVQLGPERAAKIACYVRAIPPILVETFLFAWGLTAFPIFFFVTKEIFSLSLFFLSNLPKKIVTYLFDTFFFLSNDLNSSFLERATILLLINLTRYS